MKPVLLSLALLGTTARGCFFRGDAPRDSPSRIERIRLGNLRGGPIPGESLLTHQEEEATVRERRVVGKRALKDACSDNVEFDGCHRDKGSALQLETCLRKRSRTISGTCLEGIETWKTLLAETSPGARRRPSAGDMEARRSGESERYRRAGGKAEELELLKSFEEDVIVWVGDEGEPLPPFHGISFAGGRPDHGPFGAGFGARPPHHHRDGPGGAPWEHHPPPHHFGKGPRFGPLSGHPHHEAGPGPRPSMFSVLADWLFATPGDSSSSDSSSSDSSSSSSSSSSSADGFIRGFDAGFGAGLDAGLDDVVVGLGMEVDAGFFPAGHPRPSGGRPLPGVGAGRSNLPGDVKFSWLQEDADSFGSQDADFARLDLKARDHFKGEVDVASGGLPPRRPPSTKQKRPFINTDKKNVATPADIHNHRNHLAGMLMEDGPVHVHHRFEHARPTGRLPGPQHAGGGGGGHNRDHIRNRNRHPEDRSPWFVDSFDSVEDLDLVEGVLALFFFIGSVTLLLLPFFLLARALKRLVRRANVGRGGGDAPDGYQALPEDEAAATVAAVHGSDQQLGGSGRGGDADDDDAIVVTGTPVNPPPSVHL